MTNRRTTVAACAAILTSLAATAFVPAVEPASTGPVQMTTTLDGTTVSVTTDDDPGTRQPVILLVGATPQEALDRYETQDSYRSATPTGQYAYASVATTCEAWGEDEGDVRATLDWLRGGRAGDDGTRVTGSVDSRAVLQASGTDALAAVRAVANLAFVQGLVLVAPVLDPYDIAFSGGVRRVQEIGGAPVQLPCAHGGATDGTRDAWWDEHDVTGLADRVTVPTYIAAPKDTAPGAGATFHVAMEQADVAARRSIGRVLNVGADADTEEEIDAFTDRLVAGERIADHYGTTATIDGGPCLLGDCLVTGTSVQANYGDDVQPPSHRALFLNRTFEQDYDCVPVCVPGPGTGEIGSLEKVNRFSPPWAPTFTWVGATPNSEQITSTDPLNDGSGGELGDEGGPGGHGYHSLAFTSPQFGNAAAVVGEVYLDGWFSTSVAGGTVTPILVLVDPSDDVLGDGFSIVSRGALDLDFSGGLDEREHVSGWKPGRIVFDEVALAIPRDAQLMVVLQSSNVDHFENGTPQATVNVATGPQSGFTAVGSTLHLPLFTELTFQD